MSNQTAAFARATQARGAISEIIESVRSGQRDLDAAFDAADSDPLMGRCFAVKVIEAVPGIGKVRARRTMAKLGLAEGVWLVDVPAETRAQAIEALSGPTL